MSSGESGEKLRRQWAPDARALELVGDRWLMVIVRDLAAGPLRLETLRRWLPGVSAGALQARLEKMERAGLLARRRRRSLPPRVDLELTARGRGLAQAIGELARWELATRWSEPGTDEWVDVAACFRLAPFLDVPNGQPYGELALTVLGADDAPVEQWAYVRAAGRTRIERREAPGADAGLRGTASAWARALAPGGGTGTLSVSGRRELADAFVGLFAAPPAC